MEKVIINERVWSKSSLKVSSFNNGDPITRARTINEWEQAFKNRIPAFYTPIDDTPIDETRAVYSYLYNYYALTDPRGLFDKTKWMIPQRQHWEELIAVCGGAEVAGYNLKSKSGWSHIEMEHSISCRKCKEWNEEYKSKVPCHQCKDSRQEIITSTDNGTDAFGFNAKPSGVLCPDFPPSIAYAPSCASWWIDDSDKFRWDKLPVLGSFFDTYRPIVAALSGRKLDCEIIRVEHNTGNSIRLFAPYDEEGISKRTAQSNLREAIDKAIDRASYERENNLV